MTLLMIDDKSTYHIVGNEERANVGGRRREGMKGDCSLRKFSEAFSLMSEHTI